MVAKKAIVFLILLFAINNRTLGVFYLAFNVLLIEVANKEYLELKAFIFKN